MDWNKLNADVNCILSKHYTPGRSGKSINKIVIHYNAGDLTVEGCYSVWQTREASAHYQVESSGRIGQLVWDGDTAWHAGNWDANCTSIGVEHANKDGGYITDACLDAGAHLVAALCVYYKLGRPKWKINVFPHNYFASTSCPGRLGDEQNAAYMQRAQQWYDNMTKGTSVPSKPAQQSSNSNPKVKTGYVEVLFNGLTIRNKPSWDNSAAAGTVKKGEVFTVVNGQNVDGVWMYQIKSGKWITSASEYVRYRATLHSNTPSQPAKPTKKTLDQIVEEVINGKWGNDPQRSQKLRAAGYDPEQVRNKVNNQLLGISSAPKMTARQFALEVWNEGKHGAGAAREAAAKRLGVNYAEAQRLINILASGGKI